MSLKQQLESDFEGHKRWALRRQMGIPNNRRLWVCACMEALRQIEWVGGRMLWSSRALNRS